MKKHIGLCLMGASLALSGCNTVAGIGKDLQAAGAGVSNVAVNARESMTDESDTSSARPQPLPTGPSHAPVRN